MNGFRFVFPAIKGLQAGKEYYVAMCPLNVLPRMFQLPDEDLLPEFRAQRVLNKSRIPHITRYIIQNPNDYVFSSLAASVDGEMVFEPLGQASLGLLSISMDAKILINDGQHRRAAIEEALKQSPILANETISVVFFHDRGLKRCQQMFADLNKHAVNTTKSIGILYDGRDPFSNLVRDIVDEIPLLRDYTNKERDNLSKLAPQIFTLTNIYNSVEKIIGKKQGQEINTEDAKFVKSYWNLLCQSISEWKDVQAKELKASQLRKNFIHAHGVVLDAFGLLGNYIYNNEPTQLKRIIPRLNKINWSRANKIDWLGRAISNDGTINKTKDSPFLTFIHIKRLIQLPISNQELAFEQKYYNGK